MVPEVGGTSGASTGHTRLQTLDCLRGIAALSVAWFHVTCGNPRFSVPEVIKASGAHGWLGVEVFFVISGFVISYALHGARYELRDYGRFLLKRIVRLDPPYLVSLVAVVALGYASAALPGFRGRPPSYTVPQLAAHVGYATGMLGYEWVNIAYWSLALEFQYYLLMGLVFPLVNHRSVWIRGASLTGLGVAALVVREKRLVLPWCLLFVSGILTFQFREGRLGRRWYVGGLLLAGVGNAAVLGVPVALVGAGTALVIGAGDVVWSRPLLFLGNVSYSLYLVHVPIAGRIVNASLRIPIGQKGNVAVALTALGASIVGAALLYWFVERPARSWASKIRYHSKEREGTRSNALMVNSPSEDSPVPG